MKKKISGMIHSPARISNRWDIAGEKKKKDYGTQSHNQFLNIQSEITTVKKKF